MPWVKISSLQAKRWSLQRRKASALSRMVRLASGSSRQADVPAQPAARGASGPSSSLQRSAVGQLLLECQWVSTELDAGPNTGPNAGPDAGLPGMAACLPELVQIPQGRFLMGSSPNRWGAIAQESPQHWVSVAGFALGKYPVTQAQWRWVAGLPPVARSLNPQPSHFCGDEHPVEGISWWDAREFCQRLSQLTGHYYRLPSEAEWEYACRARSMGRFSSGQQLTRDRANFSDTAAPTDGQTSAVDHFPLNAFGLGDMHGNVWEWCADDWHDNYSEALSTAEVWLKDACPENERQERAKLEMPDYGHSKVLRGGSWAYGSHHCRSAARANAVASLRLNQIGFRVVRERILYSR